MFSHKELVVFAGSIGFGLAYMIFKLSYEMAKSMNGIEIGAAKLMMLRYQILIFLLYLAMIFVHTVILIKARRFLNNPVKDNYGGFQWLTRSSGVLMLFVIVSFVLAMFDGFYFLGMWAVKPIEATKFSFFPYWLYRVYNNPVREISELAVLWQIPMIVLEILFGIFCYKRYHEASDLYLRLYPKIPRDGIYNAFGSNRKSDKVHFAVPEEDIADDDRDVSVKELLHKPVSSNSLYSVEPPPKEKTHFKSQTEIDEESGVFFDSAEEKPIPPIPKTRVERESLEDEELIPVDIDLSKLRNIGSKTESSEETKVPCPFCGFLNAKGGGECEFCGAEIGKN